MTMRRLHPGSPALGCIGHSMRRMADGFCTSTQVCSAVHVHRTVHMCCRSQCTLLVNVQFALSAGAGAGLTRWVTPQHCTHCTQAAQSVGHALPDGTNLGQPDPR